MHGLVVRSLPARLADAGRGARRASASAMRHYARMLTFISRCGSTDLARHFPRHRISRITGAACVPSPQISR